MDHDVDAEEARPSRRTDEVCFSALAEGRPGRAWQNIFERAWPGWSNWLDWNRSGDLPSRDSGARALRRHMPEMLAVWERLVEAAGADERAAAFLTFWTPPRYLVNCSQAVVVDSEGPLLVRNYDLDPALNEACLLKSKWLGREVIGMVEGMAGLADGMNAAGLAVSLAFGGQPLFGRGFGIPIILRYLLEVCTTVEEAVEVLRAVPCHMAYNVTLLDKTGRHATVMLAHDRPPLVSAAAFSTNHQPGAVWPWHERQTRTRRREAALMRLVDRDGLDGSDLQAAFLRPPLHSTRYGDGFGTVYTAAYRPCSGQALLCWPGMTPWTKSFDRFEEDARCLAFQDGRAPKELSLVPEGESGSSAAESSQNPLSTC